MKLLVVDTETSGFPGKLTKPLKEQPEIFDFHAAVLDTDSLEIVETLSFKCKPKRLLPPHIDGKYGATNEDLEDLSRFESHYDDLFRLFSGVDMWVAHSLVFDSKMLTLEMARLGKHKIFPWPALGVCTLKVSRALFARGGHKLVDMHYRLCETPKLQAHTAEEDVTMLVDIVRELISSGEFPLDGNIQIF